MTRKEATAIIGFIKMLPVIPGWTDKRHMTEQQYRDYVELVESQIDEPVEVCGKRNCKCGKPHPATREQVAMRGPGAP